MCSLLGEKASEVGEEMAGEGDSGQGGIGAICLDGCTEPAGGVGRAEVGGGVESGGVEPAIDEAEGAEALDGGVVRGLRGEIWEGRGDGAGDREGGGEVEPEGDPAGGFGAGDGIVGAGVEGVEGAASGE